MKKSLGIISLACLLSACSQIPAGAYFNRGEPENLLDVSSEVVNLSLSTPGAVTRLSSMIAQDPPARAELNCQTGESACMQAKEILDQHNIPAQIAGGGNNVALVYERVVARDCQNRFIDNSINPYNLNHPTLGCSVTGNMVQQVGDKRQFTSPNLLDFQDAEKGVQVYREYLHPPQVSKSDSNSQLGSGVAASGVAAK